MNRRIDEVHAVSVWAEWFSASQHCSVRARNMPFI